MNAKTNYMLVGLFVLLSVILMTIFVIWLIQIDDKQEIQQYRIEFTESVSGLNIDSPVKYRGVTVGKVSTIKINPDDVEKITVLISVDRYTPIKVDTVAKLIPQGITGLRFVDLSKGSKTSKLLETKRRNEIPLIPSVPSFFVQLENSFGEVMKNISESAVRLKELLGEESQADLQRLLRHSANISAKLDSSLKPEQIEHIDQMVLSVTSLARHLDKSTPAFDRILVSGDTFAEQAKESIASLQESFARVAETMRVMDERNRNGDYSIKENIGPGMKQIESTMNDMQRSLILLNEILTRYKESPSDMLFEHRPPMVGPGERR